MQLRKKLVLLTFLYALIFLVLSASTNTWTREVSGSRDDNSDSQVRSEINVKNNTIRMLASGNESSETNEDESEINMQKGDLRVLKGKLSVEVKLAKFAAGQFLVKIEGKNPNPSSFVLGSINPDVDLYSGDYKVNIEYQDDGKEPIEQHDIVLSEDCSGTITSGQHKICEVEISLYPRIIVYTHAAAINTKASDFTIESIGNNPVPPNFPGNEEGTIVQMKYGEYGVHFKPVNGLFADYSTTAQNPCFGEIVDDGSPFAPTTPKAVCYITIDISKLKVIVKVNGGPTPVSSFKYNIKSNDVNVNGPLLDPKVYTGSSQGTEIPIGPGAYYTVQMLPFNNYDASKSGECDNGQSELGKIKVCTVTMTYNVEQDTCSTEINEQGKPVKVC